MEVKYCGDCEFNDDCVCDKCGFFVTNNTECIRNEYRRFKNMTFGKAMEEVKNGNRIQREGWNGKNQYVELATCISYKNRNGEIVNVDHESIGNQALAFVGTSGVQLGWLASQADMLANDWKVI